jgi:hypothetical protein
MDTSEFIEKLSTLLRDHGFAWVDDSVREAIEQGADVERKKASAVGLREEVREATDSSKAFADFDNYFSAFETKPGRVTATITREYTIDEVVALYLTAVYSVFVEPGELSAAGLELLGPEVESVVFAAEDGIDKFDVRQASAAASEAASKLRFLLKDFVLHAY